LSCNSGYLPSNKEVKNLSDFEVLGSNLSIQCEENSWSGGHFECIAFTCGLEEKVNKSNYFKKCEKWRRGTPNSVLCMLLHFWTLHPKQTNMNDKGFHHCLSLRRSQF
jgi:hypothetical protein